MELIVITLFLVVLVPALLELMLFLAGVLIVIAYQGFEGLSERIKDPAPKSAFDLGLIIYFWIFAALCWVAMVLCAGKTIFIQELVTYAVSLIALGLTIGAKKQNKYAF
jgi:hypothetical protein